MTKNIEFGKGVYITDPCYPLEESCQLHVVNVLPGKYIATMVPDEVNGSLKNAELHVVHKKHQKDRLKYEPIGDFIVDSGQAGVFDQLSYRDDAEALNMVLPHSEFATDKFNSDEGGEQWYDAICKLTEDDKLQGWGSYDRGVVSKTGHGDGLYTAYAAKNESGKVVGMRLIFIDQEVEKFEEEDDDWDEDMKYLEDDED